MSGRSPMDPAWYEPVPANADFIVSGSDRDLAIAASSHLGEVLEFRPQINPQSDLARALGLGPGTSPRGAVPVDLVAIKQGSDIDPIFAVNGVAFGAPPQGLGWMSRTYYFEVHLDGRNLWHGDATSVLVMNGQFMDGQDVSPRGHPGDGRLEVQIYAVSRGSRRSVRKRMATGSHLPHPKISTGSGHKITVRVVCDVATFFDGNKGQCGRYWEIEVRKGAFRLLV